MTPCGVNLAKFHGLADSVLQSFQITAGGKIHYAELIGVVISNLHVEQLVFPIPKVPHEVRQRDFGSACAAKSGAAEHRLGAEGRAERDAVDTADKYARRCSRRRVGLGPPDLDRVCVAGAVQREVGVDESLVEPTVVAIEFRHGLGARPDHVFKRAVGGDDKAMLTQQPRE